MNKNVALKPIKGTQKVLDMLEKKKLISCFRPSAELLKGNKNGGVETIYKTAPKYGTHKLIAVAKDTVEIKLTAHPDNEDVILVNNTGKKFKPLYLIIAAFAQKQFEARARRRNITARDVFAVELLYNNVSSAFTVLKGIPHCEVTIAGKGINPVFFVTEPSDFAMDMVKQHGYSFILRQGK